MYRRYFNLNKAEEIIKFLEKENIFYHYMQDQLNIFTNEKNNDELIIVDFKKNRIKINTYFNDNYYDSVDGIELGWKPYGFSIRFFKNGIDISSNLFYNIKRLQK